MSTKLTVKNVQAVLQYIGMLYPIIIGFVRQAEEVGGTGSEKLTAVRAAIEKYWNNAIALAAVWDDFVKPAVESAVVIFNIRNFFKKKS